MAEIINLNKVRKARAKIDRDRIAALNKASFGRSKAARQESAERVARAKRELDARRLEFTTVPDPK